MSKGLIDMIVVSSLELDREKERYIKGVEVPYLEKSYRNWAVKYQHLKPSTIDNYVKYIKRADIEFFITEDDLFELLRRKILTGKFDEVDKLFDRYISIMDEWYEWYKKEELKKVELNVSSKTIRDWRSAFKSYRDFFIEYLNQPMKGKLGHANEDSMPIQETEPEKKPIFAEDRFVDWMQKEEGMTYGSAHSYMSRLRSFHRDVILKNKRGVDFLAHIPLYLQSKNPLAAIELLNKLISIIVNYLHGNTTATPQRLHKYSNYKAALSKYAKFINEEMIDIIPDEEIVEETEVSESKEKYFDSDTLTIYNYEELETNFTFRLETQNRMGKNMRVFYPIDILRRLFRISQKISEKTGNSNGNYKWFNRWIDDCIANIEVITKQKRYHLADLDFLSVDSENNEVKALLSNDGDPDTGLVVLTETDVPGATPVEMNVNCLRDIHIDHSPLISQVLVDQVANLPALTRLTEIIKTVANEFNLAIIAKNFSEIGTKVLGDASRFQEMERLIPALKKELKIIETNSKLTLMAAKYNLTKKK